MEAKPCKRGNIAARDKTGHCLCADCKVATAAGRDKERLAAYRAAWNAKNKDRLKGYAAKWLAANPEKRKAAVDAWRAKNPEKVKEMSARAGKKWSAANKGKVLQRVRARQLAQRQRMPKWCDRKKVAEVYVLAAKLTAETGIPHEVDHVIPLQGETVSGLHVHQNLRVIPRRQNRAKKNKLEALCAA